MDIAVEKERVRQELLSMYDEALTRNREYAKFILDDDQFARLKKIDDDLLRCFIKGLNVIERCVRWECEQENEENF